MPTWGMGRQANRDFGEQYSASEIDADADDENDADDADADDADADDGDQDNSVFEIVAAPQEESCHLSLSNHLSHSNSA